MANVRVGQRGGRVGAGPRDRSRASGHATAFRRGSILHGHRYFCAPLSAKSWNHTTSVAVLRFAGSSVQTQCGIVLGGISVSLALARMKSKPNEAHSLDGG